MMTFRHVLDATVALLVEAYRSYGMDFFAAVEAAMQVGVPEAERVKTDEPEPDNSQSMQALQAMMAGTGMKFGV